MEVLQDLVSPAPHRDPDHQATTPDFPDFVAFNRRQPGHPGPPNLVHPRQCIQGQNREGRQHARGRQRVAAKGRSMNPSGQPFGDRRTHGRYPNRNPAGQALAQTEDIGLDTLAFRFREHPGPAGARLDLVHDQQNLASRADLAEFAEVAVGRHHDAALTLDRLDNNGCRVRGNGRIDRRRRSERDVFHRPPEPVEHGPVLRGVSDGQRAEGLAMIAAGTGHESATTGGQDRELERGLDRLGAGVEPAEAGLPNREPAGQRH